jgi:hypothetical protein
MTPPGAVLTRANEPVSMTSYSLIDRIGPRGLSDPHAVRTRSLRLLPSADGWSLVGLDGELVFSAVGLSGRKRCLEYAQARGALALIS